MSKFRYFWMRSNRDPPDDRRRWRCPGNVRLVRAHPAVANLGESQQSQVFQGLGNRRRLGIVCQLLYTLRNVASQVAESFEIAIDLEALPQAVEGRRQQADAELEPERILAHDLDAPTQVHRSLLVLELFGQLTPAFAKRVNALIQNVLNNCG